MAKEIGTFAMSQMTLGATCDFHNSVNGQIKALTPAVLHLEDKAVEYSKLCENLQLIVNRSTAFVVTRSMKDQDYVRDRYVGVLRNVSRAHLTNPDAERSEAATILCAVLAPYAGIGEHEYSRETAEINGMVAILEQPENAAAAALLGLTSDVEGLKAANAKFKELFEAKADELTARRNQKDTDTKELCKEINAAYAEIVKVVNAYAIVETSDEIEQFIDKVNGFISVYSSIMDRKPSGGSSTDPEDPEEPEDSETPEGGDEGEEEEGGGTHFEPVE